ncbi:response regulator [Psychrosphaera sp. 1_MG-2023]|uniref:winged helix-turn-helix domain-containing protein n=1 Tax=Psychrosphaera sp. 1_MG-2023 TaxID=3062643 RepID=UPI0026E1BFF1|nr:winged helix-turn-helix domain-containing protein [Psychrosphaera sp. 1_MG-2023]MDO6720622.1 response regulator [Psychrosphaera sp. 1_MG-2023]
MTDNFKPHILLVEDDKALAEWICDYLRLRHFDVTHTTRGDDAVELINDINPDVVLLDGMLPGLDGLDVCKQVRPHFSNGIIMITARDEEVDEVLGLEMGADDFLVKPIRARALLTRINLILKRQEQLKNLNLNQETQHDTQASSELSFGSLTVNQATQVVSLGGQILKVSSKEFELLWVLAKHAGEVISRERLVTELRGFDYDGFDRSIDIRISKLRKKLLDDASNPFRIKTVWGKGYLFVKDAW